VFIFVLSQGVIYSQSEVKTKKITIWADKGWQDTGIQLKAKQYYSIHACGWWSSGLDVVGSGPEGGGYGTIVNGALLGWIADKQPKKLDYESYKKEIIGKIILIGQEAFLKSYGEGKLWLTMGEWSGCEDCQGKIEVLITIYE
jgi:hypothetical protein